MRYYGEEALGLVETVGLVPALEAADKMLKAADVELILKVMPNGGETSQQNWIILTAIYAAAAAAIGKLTAKNVMPRPIREVGDIVSVHDIDA